MNLEIKTYQEMFGDLLKLLNRYQNPDDTQEFWSGLHNRAMDLQKKYQSSYFSKMEALTLQEIENKIKK